MAKRFSLVHGIGINDADSPVTRVSASGKRIHCKYYSVWASMICRCYSTNYHNAKPTYSECEVCEEWLTFSNFKRWMQTKDWQGKHLDKDILFPGNKIYSPATCCFVSQIVNSFFADSGAIRGNFKIGVCFDKQRGKFTATCGNPITRKREMLGRYSSEDEAYGAWLSMKMSHAESLAATIDDELISEAVKTFYHKTTAKLVKVNG